MTKKLLILIFFALIVILLFRVENNHANQTRSLTPIATPTESTKTPELIGPPDSISPSESPSNTPLPTTPPTVGLPAKISIEMPFTTQAPHTNWDALHEDACEEASLIMVMHYINNTKITSKESAEEEILQMVKWETENELGYSITLQQLIEVAKHYGIKTARIGTANKEKIQKELSDGKPVIVPAAGRELDNPNFKTPGPLYHMLVIKGYDKNGWITNDPGTRKGEGFRYTYDNLLNAIHNWDANDINNGAKEYMVID
jgi:protein-tyrosine-phosphatase